MPSTLWIFSVAFSLFFLNLPIRSERIFRNRYARQVLPIEYRIEIASMIRFRDYYGSTMNEFVERSGYPLLTIDEKSDEESFGPRSRAKSLVMYLHGYRESPKSESVRTVMEAYLKRDSVRYVVVDWSRLVSADYAIPVVLVPEVARVVADYLKMMYSLLNEPSIHLVGHSLGAHVAGLTGHYVNFSIPRVTGLDPANPGFYHLGANHISPASGKFVDVVHTDGGFYGVLQPTGHVDFYANGGTRPQPGCAPIAVIFTSENLCSHHASWRYYARTITNEHAFPALECSSFKDMVLRQCKTNGTVFFGDETSIDIGIGGLENLTTLCGELHGAEEFILHPLGSLPSRDVPCDRDNSRACALLDLFDSKTICNDDHKRATNVYFQLDTFKPPFISM